MTPLASTTSSGLKVKQWIARTVAIKETLGKTRGPLFGNEHGNIIRSKVIELALMDKLQHIKDVHPGVIPSDLDVYKDLGISRSFR